MKKTLSMILFLALSHSMVYGQLINNRLNFCLSAGISPVMGSETVNENDYITPSLFVNFEKGSNLKLRATYQLFSIISVGIQLKSTNFSDWNNGDSLSLYRGAQSKVHSLGAVLRIASKPKNTGFFNRFSASLCFVPTFNQVHVTFDQQLFTIPGGTSEDLFNSDISSLGADCSLNLEYSISQGIGVFAEGGISYIPLKSQLYADTRLLSVNANLGIFFKFMKDKHFNYH
jgi:hypothetical protein